MAVRHLFTVRRVRTVVDGSVTRSALTTSWTDGSSLGLEYGTDFDPAVGVAVIDPGGAAETIYYRDVDEVTEDLIGVIRPDPQNHAAGIFVQAGTDPVTRKLADGFFDSDPGTEVSGVPIRAHVDAWYTDGFRDDGVEEAVWIEIDEGDEDQPWIVDAPRDAAKTFDGDLGVLPPVGGGDSSAAAPDPITGKILPPNGQGFEDGAVPGGAVVAEAFGGIGDTIHVNWTTIANSSVVNYDVHVSDATGFTPGPGTLYSSHSFAGEPDFLATATIKDFPATHDLDGTASDPPVPGTDYFIVVIPRDGSGEGTPSNEVSATPVVTVPPGSITETEIADDSISTPKLQTNSVTTDALAANSVATENLQANAVTATHVASISLSVLQAVVGTLSALTANLGTVTAGIITGVTITGGTLQTATSGARVVISQSPVDEIRFHNTDSSVGLKAINSGAATALAVTKTFHCDTSLEVEGAVEFDVIGAITPLSGSFGTANNTLVAVSGTGDDTTINNNFADLRDKINEIRAALAP